MTNPFKPHVLNLFADRGSIDEAMGYAQSMIITLPNEHRAVAMTALMVVVNTAAKLWPAAPAPVAEAAPALPLDQLVAHQLGEKIVDLDARLAALADRVGVLEVTPVAPEALGKSLESWAEDNIDRHIENWADTYLDNRVESWASSNLDIEDDVREEVRNVLRDVTVSLDL